MAQTALVTGASVGIGAEFARLLAARGNDLVLVARDTQRLDALAKELNELHGVACEVLTADLTDAAQLAAVETRVADAERPVEIVVNNAGFGTFGKLHELDVDGETREIQLNVLALTRLTHAAARGMVTRGHGGILNVSSIACFQPGPLNATYSATKAYVTSFTEAVHEELKGTGVRITALCPGFTRTEFQERAGADTHALPEMFWQTPAEVARVGLDALDKNRVLAVPGTLNRVVGAFASVSPHAVTRRVAALVMRRGLEVD
jgi:short-subunit dehydrogenase